MENLHTLWQNLVDDFTNQRENLLVEIRNYPPPIPACDAQFNYLLEKRDHITVELNRLQGLEQNLTPESLQAVTEKSRFITQQPQ